MARPRVSLRKLVVLGSVLTLGLAGLAAWGRARLQSQAHAELVRVLSAASGAQVTVRSVELDLSRGLLVARAVELTDGARVMLRAAELRGRMKLRSTLTGQLSLAELELRGVQATLQTADLKRLGAELDGSPWLQSLRLTAAELNFELGQLGTLRVDRASWQLARMGDSRRLALSRTTVRWLRDGRTAAQAQLAMTCDMRSEGATCEPKLAGLEVGASKLPQLALSKVTIDTGRAAIEGDLAVREGGTDVALHYALALHGGFGASAAPRAQLRLVAHRLRLGAAAGRPAMFSVSQLTVTLELDLDGSRVVAAPVRVQLPHGELTGRAVLALDGSVTAELDSPLLDLADFESLAGAPVSGRGAVRVRSRTEGDASLWTAALELDAAAVGGVALGRLTADVTFDPRSKQLRVARAQAIAPERQLSTTDARLDFDAGGLTAADAQLQVERLPLAELYRSLGAGVDPMLARLQARSAGTATLSYRRAGSKASLDLVLGLQLSAATLIDYPFERGQLRGRITLADAREGISAGVFELQQLSLHAGGGTLELSGKLDRGALAMRIDTRGDKGLPLARWPWLREHAPAFGGSLLVSAALSGTTSRPRANLDLDVDSLAFRGQALGSVSLAARLSDRAEPLAGALLTRCRGTDSKAAVEAVPGWRICGDGLHGQLRMDVTVGNVPDRALRGQLELDRFSLRPFLPPSAAGKPTSGLLSATLSVAAGSASQPDRISGRAQVLELAVGEEAARLASVAPFELEIRSGQLALRDAVVKGSEQRYTLSAEGSLGNRPRFIADGAIGAGVFTRTTEPLVMAFGEVGVRLQWSVTETPAVTARADLRDLAVRVGTATFRNVRGTLAVEGDRVSLAGVSAALGAGRIDVSGQLGLAGLRLASYDLAVKAERLALQPDPMIDIELDARNRLRWTGGSAVPELSGHLKLKRLVYRKALHPETLAHFGRKSSNASASVADRLMLDLTIENEQPLRIRNSLIDGELSCAGAERSLRVVGSDRRVGVIGQLAVTRGRLLFQGDEFKVQRGLIDFRDPQRIAPKFDLLAVAERKRRPEARVVLSASGTDDRFDVDVRCEAPESAIPPPFSCRYSGAKMQCDDLDQLVALFVCKQGTARPPAKTQ